MSKSKLLSKLLSGLCCVAMLVTMLPIIPAAAADNGVLFEESFSSYTSGAELAMGDKFKLGSTQIRKDAATPGSYSFTTVNGALKISATDVVDSGDVGEVYGGVMTAATFADSYTLTFDWMQETEDVYCTILYLAGTEVRVRMQNPTSTSNLYNTVFFVNDGNQYLTNPDSGAQFKLGAAFGTWFTFEYFVDAEAGTVTLNVYDKASGEHLGTHTLKKAPVADKGFEIRHFSVQGNDESGKTSTCYVDNIKVVSGIVETDRTGGAAAGTTIGGAAMSNFSDAAEITYTKAAEVTAGLGLFAGADGKFMPKGTVTRAQMATIIVKMLNGSDVNADSFKGTGKFNDVAGFEGGWAEGYVNWCSTLGIVSGYGDGTFRPGNQVTAAEAATMILNALKVDAGAGTWPHTVMAKAEELDMFDELLAKPTSDKPLSREELAVMALVGLEYSPEGKQGYEYNGIVYDNYMDAFMIAGAGNANKINPTQGDSLAGKIFELKTLEGFITGNQSTGLEYTEINGVYTFNITTGLEHIGHYVTVYYAEAYQSEEEPGMTYTVYDETKVFTVADEDIDTAKEYKALFGKNYRVDADGVAMIDGQYNMADTLADTIPGYVAGSYAPMGTYFVYEGAIVAYMAPVTVYATKVLAVENVEGYETIELNLPDMPPISNSEDDDCIVEYKGVAEDDYVTFTVVGSESDAIYVLNKTKVVTGTVSKMFTNEDGQRVVVVKGKEYVAFGADNNTTGLKTDEPTDFNATYTFYVTDDGKYLGYEKSTGAADLTKAVFVLGQLQKVESDSYGKKVRTTYARGVDLDGNEIMLPVKIENGTYNNETKEFTPTDALTEQVDAIATGFFNVEDATGKDAKKENLKVLTAFSTTYDEDESPIYAGRSNIGVGKTVSPYNFGVGGYLVNRNTSAPCLMLEGEATQSTALTATVKKGSWSTFINDTGATINRYLLLSRADNGTVVLEAMVMNVTGDGALDAQTVYIADINVANGSRNSEGYEYTVYDYKTGAAKTITMEEAIGGGAYEGSGYYKIAAVDNSQCMQLVSKVPDVYECGASNVKYDNADERVEEDGLYNENLFLDQVFQYITNNELSTTKLANRGSDKYTDSHGWRLPKADGAIVIDTRTQAAIDAFGLGKISDIGRIESLTERNEDLVILFDLCFDTSGKKVLTVFVKDMYYDASNGLNISERNGVTFINGKPVADNCVIIDTRVYSEPVTSFTEMKAMLDTFEFTGTYTVANGKIDSFTITSAREIGVFVVDDYERYEAGTALTVAEAASKEVYYQNIAKSGSATATVLSGVAGADGKVLQLKSGTESSSRQYLYLGNPGGGYKLDFDLMRPASCGNFDVILATCNGAKVELRIRGNNNKIGVYGLDGTKTYYFNPDNNTTTSDGSALTAAGEGSWYNFSVMMNSDGVLTCVTTMPDGAQYTHQIEIPGFAFTNVYFDSLYNSSKIADNYVDNVSYVAWDGEIGVDTDGIEVTVDNGAYAINGTPVADTVVITNKSSETVTSMTDVAALAVGKTVTAMFVVVDGEITELTVTGVALKLPAKLLYVEPMTVQAGASSTNKILSAEADAWVLDPVDGGVVGEKITLPVGTSITVTNTTARRNVGQYNIYNVSIDGEVLGLTPYAFARGGDYKNRVGRHNEIYSFEAGVLTMVDAHSYLDTDRSNDQDGSTCYDFFSNSLGAVEAPLTLTDIDANQVVFTANGTTTVGALAARTDARIVLDYFMGENGEPVFFFLYQDDEEPFANPLYVPAEGDVLMSMAPITISGITSNKGHRADFMVLKGSVPAGTMVHVRYLDIFKVGGAAVASGDVLAVGPFVATASDKLPVNVLTQLESEELEQADIAGIGSATVMDMRTQFITECPAIENLVALKAAAANSQLIVTAQLISVGSDMIVVVENVTTKVVFNETFSGYTANQELPRSANVATHTWNRSNNNTWGGTTGCLILSDNGDNYLELKTVGSSTNGQSGKTQDIRFSTNRTFGGNYTIYADVKLSSNYYMSIINPMSSSHKLRIRLGATGVYFYSTTTGEYVKDANGNRVQLAADTWYTFELIVNEDAGTLTANIYNGTTLLGSATQTGVTVSEDKLKIEHYGSYTNANKDITATTCWDNIKIVVE